MLGITRQADYALRATVEVARLQEGERIPTAEIATRQDIPLPFLTKIVSQLVVRGILTATRGARGGISLAREPKDVSMLEVIEAIDGPVMLNRCTRDPGACEYSSTCPVCEVFVDTEDILLQRLRKTSLHDLVQRALVLEGQQA
mgnify:CR=1 FL=1